MTKQLSVLMILVVACICSGETTSDENEERKYQNQNKLTSLANPDTDTQLQFHRPDWTSFIQGPLSSYPSTSVKTLFKQFSLKKQPIENKSAKARLGNNLPFVGLHFICSLLKKQCSNDNKCKFCKTFFLKVFPWKQKDKHNSETNVYQKLDRLFIEHPGNTRLYAILHHRQRRLLDSSNESSESIQTDIKKANTSEESRNYAIREVSHSSSTSSRPYLQRVDQQTLNITELVKLLKQDISKDPLWATLCVTFLIFLMLLCMKLCGLKPINRGHEVNVDIDDSIHHVDVYEVIRIHQRYLPKRFQRFKRRWRRKWKKRFKVKEAPKPEPTHLDNSEEEREIYAQKMTDF